MATLQGLFGLHIITVRGRIHAHATYMLVSWQFYEKFSVILTRAVCTRLSFPPRKPGFEAISIEGTELVIEDNLDHHLLRFSFPKCHY